MSCDAFKVALAKAIRREGARVAMPRDFEVGYSAPGDPHVRYNFGGLDGLSGHLNCVKGMFSSFDISADLSLSDSRVNAARLIRSWALAEAALCARGGLTDAACGAAPRALAKKAMAKLLQQEEQGNRSPSGDQFADFANDTQLDISVTKDGTLSTLAYWPPHRQ